MIWTTTDIISHEIETVITKSSQIKLLCETSHVLKVSVEKCNQYILYYIFPIDFTGILRNFCFVNTVWLWGQAWISHSEAIGWAMILTSLPSSPQGSESQCSFRNNVSLNKRRKTIVGLFQLKTQPATPNSAFSRLRSQGTCFINVGEWVSSEAVACGMIYRLCRVRIKYLPSAGERSSLKGCRDEGGLHALRAGQPRA